MMNDEFYDNHENIREAWHQQLTQDDSYRSGLRFARRLRLARIVGLAALFIPLASVLVSQFLSGVWWLLLVGWVFVWPHLAWQLAFRSAEPNSSEIVNLKIDAIIAGVWMGLTGCSALPTAALGILPAAIGQFHRQQKHATLQVATMNNTMLLAGLKSCELYLGIGRMSDPELMSGLNYELLFLESLKLVVRPNHPLLQDTVTLSRVMEWPVVVSPKGTVPRQNAEALLQMQGCTLPSGCIETLSASLSRQLTVDYDYVWFVPSGAVKDDLRRGVLTALPVTSPGAGEPIGILTRVDAPLSEGAQTLLSAIRKSMPL